MNETGSRRIVVLDNLAQRGLDMLEASDGIDFQISTGLAGDELRAALLDADGAVCRSGVKITADVLDGNTRLKAIARAGVGTDNIDKDAASKQGIVVMNTPGGNTISTCEMTMALLLGMSRHIAPAYASLQAGKWDRKKFQGSQVEGKTLGIVGLGRIGWEVARRSQAFGMSIVGLDPFITEDTAAAAGIKLVQTVHEMLPDVDYLTVHTPLTPETENLISDAEIEIIKPGARLINCARGGIFDEAALARGLESGKLAGVALDVYPDEPCTDNPLFGMEGVLCTPHLGASTLEAQINVAVEAVEILIKFLKTGDATNPVNQVAVA
ncbi:MAG: hydroxyacid dehydrogenase [Planctomycetota bacterium]